MFGFSRSIDAAVAPFEDMFVPDGEDFLYYAGAGRPGVRVTRAERDAFVATYRRQTKILMGAFLVWTLLIIGVMVATDVDADDGWPFLIQMGAIIVPLIIAIFWLISAPKRALARRAPATAAQSRADVRRRMLERVGWGQIVLTIVFGLFIVWSATGFDFSTPKGWFFSALGVFCFGGGLLSAYWKWSYEREGR